MWILFPVHLKGDCLGGREGWNTVPLLVLMVNMFAFKMAIKSPVASRERSA
ncbi:hypothetical protein CPB86DRAFT_780872 [Serendipita vermifera]|nr:hypothetical protein CPB86DRAFT_780872 [Serendipita vermifera]